MRCLEFLYKFVELNITPNTIEIEDRMQSKQNATNCQID